MTPDEIAAVKAEQIRERLAISTGLPGGALEDMRWLLRERDRLAVEVERLNTRLETSWTEGDRLAARVLVLHQERDEQRVEVERLAGKVARVEALIPIYRDMDPKAKYVGIAYRNAADDLAEVLGETPAQVNVVADAWDEGVATALNYAVRNDDGVTLRLEHSDGSPWRNPYRAALADRPEQVQHT